MAYGLQRFDAIGLGQQIARHGAEAKSVVEFAVSQQSSIGSDPRTMELQLHAVVEIEPQRTID